MNNYYSTIGLRAGRRRRGAQPLPAARGEIGITSGYSVIVTIIIFMEIVSANIRLWRINRVNTLAFAVLCK